MARDEGRRPSLNEGQVTKGGHNPPNLSTERPPAPKGSGGAQTSSQSGQGQSNSNTGSGC